MALRLQDRDRFESAARLALRGVEQPLAAYSLPTIICAASSTGLFPARKERFLALGHSPDGLFLALPPLGEGPIASSLAEAFRGMKEENQGRPVTRVEHLPAELVAEVRALGYRVTALEPDYVYEAAAMADLSGDAYKSQRAACNRFVREQAGCFERYRSDDRHDCLALFRDWVGQKHAAGADDHGRALLEDAAGAHEEALSEHAALGLIGGVVRVGGRICAYTLGTWLTPAVFCVLIEAADRTVTGLGPFIFREFCRCMRGWGTWVNTMDDSGFRILPSPKICIILRTFCPIIA
ncbi:MAG: phosphatidylglycerol lysyltransferase domain-containing protein [Nitrospiraceae bacterium]